VLFLAPELVVRGSTGPPGGPPGAPGAGPPGLAAEPSGTDR
jgi:hypothetical protein